MNKTSREAQTAWPGGSVAGKVEQGDPLEGYPQAARREATGKSASFPVALGVRVGLLSGTLLGTHETFHKYMLK